MEGAISNRVVMCLDGFPVLCEDELLYGAFGRFCDWAEYSATATAKADLIGPKKQLINVLMPDSIKFLALRLPAGLAYSAKHLVLHHTLFPYQAAFQNSKARRKLYRLLLAHGRPPMVPGHPRTHVLQYLRICSECAAQDIPLLGEPYLHRSHQIAGINVCYEHRTLLTEIPISARSQRHFLSLKSVIAGIPEPVYLTPSNPDHVVLLQLAKDAHWLLSRGEALPDAYDRYLQIAQNTGLAHRQRISTVKFLQKSSKMLSPPLLDQLRLGFSRYSPISLYFSRRVQNAPPTLHHLLALYVLEVPVEKFFSGSVSDPAGEHTNDRNHIHAN